MSRFGRHVCHVQKALPHEIYSIWNTGVYFLAKLCAFRFDLYPPKDCWTPLEDKYWALLLIFFKNKVYPVTYVTKIETNIATLVYNSGRGDLYPDIALVEYFNNI